MTSSVAPKIDIGSYKVKERERILERLVAKPHPEGATIGTPYYDEEFDLPQSRAHFHTIHYLITLLGQVADREGLEMLGDNPVWYWDPAQNEQRIVYPDYALVTPTDLDRVTAKSLRLTLEVVSTERPDKERKDTVRMRKLNEFNAVPEFLLVYPDLDDERTLIWYRYNRALAAYDLIDEPANRRYRSMAIPGLEIEVLEPAAWSLGRKLCVYYRGQAIREAKEEREAREHEQRAREHEQRAREREQQARERAEQKAAEEMQAREREQLERERAEQRAAGEKEAREAAERKAAAAQADKERLLALLKQAGIEP